MKVYWLGKILKYYFMQSSIWERAIFKNMRLDNQKFSIMDLFFFYGNHNLLWMAGKCGLL